MKKHFFIFVLGFMFLVSCSRKITTYDSIPIRYDSHLYLDVKLGDEICGNFIFDTGWNGITLDSLFCKKNRLDYKTTDIEGSGIGNLTRTFKLITDTIHFEFSNKEYRFSSATTMIDLKSMINKKIDGIAGIQTFAQKPYMIDYVSQKIVFTDSVKGYEAVNAQFEDGNIYLGLSITLKNEKKFKGGFYLIRGLLELF